MIWLTNHWDISSPFHIEFCLTPKLYHFHILSISCSHFCQVSGRHAWINWLFWWGFLEACWITACAGCWHHASGWVSCYDQTVFIWYFTLPWVQVEANLYMMFDTIFIWYFKLPWVQVAEAVHKCEGVCSQSVAWQKRCIFSNMIPCTVKK